MFRKAFTIGAAAMLCAASVPAQQRGTVEFGAFGSAGRFDQSLTLNHGVGAGGHLGVYLDPRWAIEFEKGEMKASRTLGLASVNVGILSARLVATPIKSGAFSIHMGAGAGGSTETNFLHTYGINAVVGAKIALSNFAAIRIDAINSWYANYDWKAGQRLQAGLSFYRSPAHTIQTVEVPSTAAPCNTCMIHADSVSADEQARRRQWERDYRNLRDSLNRNPPMAPLPPSSTEARSTMEEHIHFEFDRSDINLAAREILDEKVAVFRANPTMTIMITGHAGNMGTENYNQALGERRAEAAKAYLVAQGIDASRISTDSKGEMEPVVSPPAVGKAANAPNRRDMFNLVIVPDVIKKP